MKKLSVLLLGVALSLSVSAQKAKTIYAEGPVVKTERTGENFTSIEVSSGIDVYLTQGNTFNITIEAEKNLHEYIQTEIKDGVLKVFTKVNIRKSKVKKVHVTMKKVKELTCNSAGDIYGQTTIEADELHLNTNSAGDITLKVKANSIIADCSSAGDITLSGKADFLEGNASSAGDLDALDLLVRKARVSASSAGSIRVNVSEELHASASSTGDIRYKGNPEVEKKVSSLGSIKKL